MRIAKNAKINAESAKAFGGGEKFGGGNQKRRTGTPMTARGWSAESSNQHINL